MKSEREIRDLFINREFIGNVLRLTSLLEFDLDCTLTQYFIRHDRITYGLDEIISEITFNQKIEILAKIPIRKSVISHPKAISRLRSFRRIRNIAAHNQLVTLTNVRNLLNDKVIKRMLEDYPLGITQVFRETRDSLSKIRRTKEFQNPFLKDTVNPFEIMVEKIFD